VAHGIHRVVDFEKLAPYKLRVRFDDGSEQEIDFMPVLKGEVYRPLRDQALFDRVEIDREAHTLVWPNGADFDPTILHDWPERSDAFRRLVDRWEVEAGPLNDER
jgi:hypothetical protein